MSDKLSINIPNIIRLADVVAELEPASFRMGTWLHTPRPHGWPNPDDPVDTALFCGTVGCLAGWACVALDPKWSVYGYDYRPRPRAAQLLGLDEIRAELLFLPVLGTEAFCQYDDIMSGEAAATLRHLAATGEVRWMAEPKVWRHFVHHSPEVWELDVLETDRFCDVAGVFYTGDEVEVNLPVRMPERACDEVRSLAGHIRQTWRRVECAG